MTDLISIKVTIAEKVYPIKVSGDEIESVQKAAALISDKLDKLKAVYKTDNKEHLLSMVALQLAGELVGKQSETPLFPSIDPESLIEIDALLDGLLVRSSSR